MLSDDLDEEDPRGVNRTGERGEGGGQQPVQSAALPQGQRDPADEVTIMGGFL
jgi:hypothetical protein